MEHGGGPAGRPGWWGMYESVEPRVRRLVAGCLGVDGGELAARTSLADDLAVDSLELVEVAVALEQEFQIVVSEQIVEGARTYGDLVHATVQLVYDYRDREARDAGPPPLVWTRLVFPDEDHRGSLLRADWLTPYVAQTIAEDALWAGHGARLDVTVEIDDEADLERVLDQFAPLVNQGAQVCVRRTGSAPGAAGGQLQLPLPRGALIEPTPPPEFGPRRAPQWVRLDHGAGRRRRATRGDR